MVLCATKRAVKLIDTFHKNFQVVIIKSKKIIFLRKFVNKNFTVHFFKFLSTSLQNAISLQICPHIKIMHQRQRTKMKKNFFYVSHKVPESLAF